MADNVVYVAPDVNGTLKKVEGELAARVASSVVMAAAALALTWWSPWSFTVLVLIGAAILGYFVFGDLPDHWTWVGSAVIISSGLYIGYRERVRYQQRNLNTSR